MKNLISSPILARLPKFGPPKSFLCLLPLVDIWHCCKLSSYAIWRKTDNPNSRKCRKTSFWAWFRSVGPKFGLPFFFFFFFENLASSVTRWHGQLSSWTISEKTNDPIFRKFSDGRTDRETDESDFIGSCPTNVERPTSKYLNRFHET